MVACGLRFTGITITAGDGQTLSGLNWRVSKLVLVSGLQARLHAGNLKFARRWSRSFRTPASAIATLAMPV